MTLEQKKHFLIQIAFYAVALALFYLSFRYLPFYLLPFLIAFLVAMAVRRPAAYMAKKTRFSKGFWAAAIVLFAYIAVGGLLFWLGYWLYQQIYGFVSFVPTLLPQLGTIFSQFSARISPLFEGLPQGIQATLNELPDHLMRTLTDVLPGLLSSFAGGVVKRTPSILISAIVTVVASCYMAKDYDQIVRFIRNQLPAKYFKILLDVKGMMTHNLFRMARGYLLLMLITFAELTVGLLLLRVPYAVAVAAIIAVVDILPVLGTGTVVIPWAIVSLVTGNVWRAVGLLVLYLAITVLRNFLEPKVIGSQMGMHPLLILLSMFCGLRLFGFLGMFCLPVLVIILINLQKQGTIHIFRTEPPPETDADAD